MNCLSINWSHFANLMNYGNTEVINLNTGVLSKQDLGYLFYTIKPFFLSEFNNTVKRYIAIVKRKFLIDGDELDDHFLNKRIRSYKKSAIPSNLKLEEINKIALDIANTYH